MDKTFNSFTTFLTTHVEDGLVNDEAMEQLIVMVEDNQETHADFQAICTVASELVTCGK